MLIEILHQRDPDSECYVRVWIDGVEREVDALIDVDPGRGHTAEDWAESSRWAAEHVSPAMRPAVFDAYTEGAESKFVVA